MTLESFIKQNYNHVIGTNPVNEGECVGLVQKYNLEFLGFPFVYGNAKDWLYNANPDNYEQIINDPNSPDQVPKPGDILIFNSNWGGGYGHIGIVESANPGGFMLFEQNNPIGKGSILVLHQANQYANVAGWLRPKKQIKLKGLEEGIVMTNQEDVKAICASFHHIPSQDELSKWSNKPWNDVWYEVRKWYGEANKPFNEGDRWNVNAALYGQDLGFHKDVLDKPWHDAIYGIIRSPEFAGEQTVNDGDIKNINDYLGSDDADSQKSKIWKRTVYDYIFKHQPEPAEIIELERDKIYKVPA